MISLAAKRLVELDADRRVVLVSNLMVVLCSEQDTQPIVNTGAGARQAPARLN